jgi:uncharacterized protein YbjT (DUF2867 family)
MIFLTGATGTTGGKLVELLQERGVSFRTLVRNPEKASALESQNVEVVRGDLSEPAGLERAMAGAGKLFLLSSPDERQVELQLNALAAAKKADIRYIVKVSVIGAAEDSPVKLGRDHAAIEHAVAESGIAHSFLRPHSFMQNLLAAAQLIAAKGQFYGCQGDGRFAVVDARDVAAVAAELLIAEGRTGTALELTGPAAISLGDAAQTFSEVLGKPVEYIDVSGEQLRSGMVASGMPEWLADDLVTLYEIFRAGHGAQVSEAIPTVTGSPARTFKQFVTDYAPAFGGGSG